MSETMMSLMLMWLPFFFFEGGQTSRAVGTFESAVLDFRLLPLCNCIRAAHKTHNVSSVDSKTTPESTGGEAKALRLNTAALTLALKLNRSSFMKY